tara:strand:+ start:854 stop:1513 length:660 start_codon:yes stop_codon:yes gene_type:complete
MSGVKYQKVKLKSSRPSPDKPTFYIREPLGTVQVKQKSTFYKGNRITNRLSDDLKLPDQVKKSAREIFRRYSNSGDMQGRKTEDSAVASVYLAARQNNFPRSLDMISKKSDVSKVRITRAAKAIKKSQSLAIKPPAAPELIGSASSKLKLKSKQVADSIRLANMYYKKGSAGSSAPGTVAAVAVYESSDKTQKQVAKAFGISDTTLRNARTRIKKSGGK